MFVELRDGSPKSQPPSPGPRRLALLLLVGISGVLSNPFTVRTAEQTRDDSTAQLRRCRGDSPHSIRRRSDGPALKFLELTKRRIWGYHADNGQHRAYEGGARSRAVRSNKPCLLFNSRNYVPISQLDAQATADVAEIGKLRLVLKQDYLNLNAELQRRQAAAIENSPDAKPRCSGKRSCRNRNCALHVCLWIRICR